MVETTTLAVLETGSNQSYIGETNRLRAAVGASQRIVEIIEFARKEAVGLEGFVILATSGKAEATFATAKKAQEWVYRVTRKAMVDIPGLDLVGVTEPCNGGIAEAVKRAYAELARLRGRLSGPRFRHQKLPWMAEADVSGEPAIPGIWEPDPALTMSPSLWSRLERTERESDCTERESDCTERESDLEKPFVAFQDRLKRGLEGYADEDLPEAILKDLAWNIDHLEDSQGKSDGPWSYLAVIHADANGLGKIFSKLGELSRSGSDFGPYEELVSNFSRRLDDCAWRAFARALKEVWLAWTRAAGLGALRKKTPVLPLVIGGDDLTVLCAGQFALLFASKYLAEFESLTGSDNLIARVVSRTRQVQPKPTTADATSGLRACAGVAIVKHHFPFSIAMQLAERLLHSAKKATKDEPCSALDWHAVLDASPPDFETLRERLKVHLDSPNGLELTRRPYAVGQPGRLPSKLDLFSSVERAVGILKRKDQDGRVILPSSQMHDLRAALFGGSASVDDRFGKVAHRYPGGIAFELAEACSGGSRTSLIGNDGRTAFLDALDHLDFFGGIA